MPFQKRCRQHRHRRGVLVHHGHLAEHGTPTQMRAVHPWGKMDPESAEEFVAVMNELGVQELAEQAFEEYGQIIIDHPDRTMWATDVLNSWHFEDAGIDMLVDFSRRFIAMLPEQIQERFAFANAWDAFSGYLD